jgi:hypothetical protein
MKKNINNIFRHKPTLLDEPEVEELVEYCKDLEDRLSEMQYELGVSKEKTLKEIVQDILNACKKVSKEHEEHLRFGYDPVNFTVAIETLQRYIISRCRDEKIYLQ